MINEDSQEFRNRYVPPPITTSGKMGLTLLLAIAGGVGFYLYEFTAGPEGPVSDGPVKEKARTVGPDDDVQKVVNQLKSGWTLRFEPGTYRLNVNFRDKRDVTLEAVRPGTQVVLNAETTTVVTVVKCANLKFTNLTLRRAGRGAWPAVHVQESAQIRFESCAISSTSGEGILVDGGRSEKIAVVRGQVTGSTWGVRAVGCRALKLEGVALTGTEKGALSLDGCPRAAAAGATFSGSEIGIKVDKEAALDLADCKVTGITKNGIEVESGAGLAMKGTTLDAIGDYAVTVGKGAVSLAIENNRFDAGKPKWLRVYMKKKEFEGGSAYRVSGVPAGRIKFND